ncbi:MAG: SUF system NifU family Fe-S cluster assembly protein [Spirochaetaceae bacterium]
MSLYKETLMKHYRNPIHKFENPEASNIMDGVNPSCGDNITIFTDITDGIIDNISFTGNGCAISMASADIMCSTIIQKDKPRDIIKNFLSMLDGEAYIFDNAEQVLEVFTELRDFPARKSCAILPWKTLLGVMDRL